MMEDFEKKLSKLFNLHIFTPASDSSLARNDLATLLKKNPGKLNFNSKKDSKSSHGPGLHDHDGGDPIDLIKYFSRKHGLPRSLHVKLVASLKSVDIPLRTKFKIVQTLKFSLVKDDEFVTFSQCLDIVASILDDEKGCRRRQPEESAYFFPKILAQLALSISVKIRPDNYDRAVHSKLELQLLPQVDLKTRSEILKKLDKWEISLGHVTSTKSSNGDEEDVADILNGRRGGGGVGSDLKNGGGGIFEPGDSVLATETEKKRVGKGMVQADAVKTQQVAMSCHKHNVSEKTEIESISLSNALNRNRSSAVQRNSSSSVAAGARGGSGSDRSWYRTSGWEISNLVEKAEKMMAIKEDDLDWLKGKTDFGFQFSNATVTRYELNRIAWIFETASAYQVIQDDILVSLAHNFFSQKLDPDYTYARMRLLKTFEIYSQRNAGRLPSGMTKNLTWFKNQPHHVCTRDMQRAIWKIFMENDSNLYESFPMAIDHIVGLRTTKHDPAIDDDRLEYVARQVVFEQRAQDLQHRFQFLEKLLPVVQDQDCDSRVRVKVAEIVEDYLVFDANGLPSNWLQVYLELYSKYDRNLLTDLRARFQSAIIRSVLRTFDKAGSDPPSSTILTLLIDLATREEDRKLEALIVVTLGNLLNRTPPVTISGAQNLAYKLVKEDTIDESACVYLETESSKEEEEAGHHGHGRTYISAIVANILVKSCKGSFEESTVTYLVQAVQKSPDKMTRILTSECLFQTSLLQPLPEFLLASVRQFTLDPIPDIQIHVTCAYALGLQRLCCGGGGVKIGAEDLNWLAKIYARDETLVLGSKNFVDHVNPPILCILESQAPLVHFSDEIFQLLTFILNQDQDGSDSSGETERVLEIVCHQIGGSEVTRNGQQFFLPQYCFVAVENIFLSQPKFYCQSASVLTAAAMTVGAILSDSSLEHAHQTMVLQTKFDHEIFLSFLLILAAQNNADLPDFIFHDLDLQHMILRLVNFVKILHPPVGPMATDYLGDDAAEVTAMGHEELPTYPFLSGHETGALHCTKEAMRSMLEYLSHGRKLTALHFFVMEVMLHRQIATDGVIQCLIYAAENGQSLPTQIVRSALVQFDDHIGSPKVGGAYSNAQILLLAFGLVHNNQSLPDPFVLKLVNSFCRQTARGQTIGEDEEYDQILFILAKLAHHGQSPLPRVRNVAQHFCNLWKNSHNSRQRMGVLNSWKNCLASSGTNRDQLTAEERALEVVRRFCKFWKKSRSHRHRLEILVALQGIVNSSQGQEEEEKGKNEDEKINFDQIYEIFKTASQDQNSQIQETGLQALISMNWKEAQFCQPEDFKLLLSIQCRAGLSPAVGRRIRDFLYKNLDHLPKHLKAEIGFLEELQDFDDQELLERLGAICGLSNDDDDWSDLDDDDGSECSDSTKETGSVHQWRRTLQDLTLMKSQALRQRLESILQRKSDQEIFLVSQALQIISKLLPHSDSFPSTIMDAAGFAMVTNIDDPSVQKWSHLILEQLVTEKKMAALVTPTLLNYLKMLPNAGPLLPSLYDLCDIPDDPFVRGLRRKLRLENLIRDMPLEKMDNFSQALEQILDSPDFVDGSVSVDYETVMEIICRFHDNQTEIGAKTARLISLALLRYYGEIGDETFLEKAGNLIEVFIIEGAIPSMDSVTFMAYQLVIENGADADLYRALEAMTRHFESIFSRKPKLGQMDKQNLSAIMACFLEAFKRSDEVDDPFVPLETVQLLAHQLKSNEAALRHQSFQALTRLQDSSECIKFQSDDDYHDNDDDETKKEKIENFLPDMKLIAVQIFRQIFDDPDLAQKEMDDDKKFVQELLDLLFSLDYWDLKSVQGVVGQDRQKWREVLLISNFITLFATFESEKLEMALDLKKLYQIWGHEDAEKIVGLLTLRLSEEEEELTKNEESIVGILKILAVLSNDQALEILQGHHHHGNQNFGEKSRQILKKIEATALAQTLDEKIAFHISPSILHHHAQKILDTAGPQLAHLLMATISTIEDMTSLDDLLHILRELRSGKNSNLIQNTRLLQTLFPPPESGLKISVSDARILFECQILQSHLPENSRRRSRLAETFKSLLANGISLGQLETFIQLTLQRTTAASGSGMGDTFQKIFEHVISQANQYGVTSPVFGQVVSALKNSDLTWNRSDCIDTCNRILNDFAFDATEGGVKGVEAVLSEFLQKNSHLGTPEFPPDVIESISLMAKQIVLIQKGKVTSELWDGTDRHICDWTEQDIKTWAKEARGSGSNENYLVESLMVAKRAFFLVTNFHLTHVQILACIMGLDYGKGMDKGRLLQVATGSGKSAIIGVITAVKCLEGGKSVDVYTSSSVLAERDAKEWTKFYSFFGLTCDHNGDKSSHYVSGPKSCYTKNVVYGDCSQFQFDHLRDTYSDLGTLAGRQCHFAVIDEVDSMFIDDSSKLARLSSTMPGMDLLQIMYHLIWERLTFIKTRLFRLFDKMYYLEGQISIDSVTPSVVSYSFADPDTHKLKTVTNIVDYIVGGGDLTLARIHVVTEIQSFVVDHLKKYALALLSDQPVEGFSKPGEGRPVKLPKNLQDFAESQIQKWVDSAVTAVAFQENVHYIVDEGQVKPVDYRTTGVVQGSTSWNNGLHQFLQIKHGLKLGSESVTTNFLSNMAMFQKYGPQVVGFTGTLGSESSKNVLMEVYNVDLMTIPETHYKRHVRFPDLVVSGEEEWLEVIVLTTLEEASKRRGVLIICETIKQADLISDTLHRFKQVKVKVYTKNMDNQEKQIERIHPGDVIVATNLAGRGTDIKTADIEKFGGLHVCLTFLPTSLRVEEQAFGRTSRQGKKGTGQLIVIDPSGHLRTGVAGAQQLAADRDEAEKKSLDQFQSTDLDIIQMKDRLFSNFSRLFQTIREETRKEMSVYQQTKDFLVSAFKRPTPTPFEVILLQAVEERWSMFLRKLDDGRIRTLDAEKEYVKFEREILTDRKQQGKVIANGQNLFYFIQLGNHDYRQDSKTNKTLGEAKTNFDRAIQLDPQFASAAYVGKAFVLLKGRLNLIWFDGHDNGYKEEALKCLEAARPLLYDEIGLLTTIQSLIQKQNGGRMDSPLFHQLTEKSNLLGSYLKNVEATISIIEKSLRRVICTGIETEQDSVIREETRRIPDDVIQSTKQVPWTHFQKYQLTFHDLTVREDACIVHDQAVNTLSFDDWKTTVKQAGIKIANTFKSWFDSDAKTKELKKFTVSLVCRQMDLGEFSQADEALRHKFELCIDIGGVELLAGDKLDFDFGQVKPPPKSFDLCVILALPPKEERKTPAVPAAPAAPTAAEAAAKKRELSLNYLKNLKFELHLLSDNDDGDNKGRKLVSIPGDVGKKLKLFETGLKELLTEPKGGEVSLKFIDLTSSQEIEKVVRLLKLSTGLSIVGVALGLNSVEKKVTTLKPLWENYLRPKFSDRMTVHLKNLDESGAKKVIPTLRKLRIEFSLQCQNLDLDTAQFVLGKADIGQEDIVQADLKELTQLFMSERLPLMELRDLSARGICLIVTFNESAFVPWISVTGIALLAAVQTTAGAALICTGFGATVGMGLVTEGMADLVTVQRIYSTRQFSWTDYSIQKAVSLTISAVSMGLSSLKDGAKGAAMLAQGAVTEAVEQAGTQVLVNGKVLNTTIQLAGKNLKSLAVKHVAVSVVETGARVGLKSLADSLADFGFDQVRDGIVKNVGERVDNEFCDEEFKKILSFYFALDRKQMALQVQNIVEATMNPKSSSAWLQLWSSVGSPLCSGILSSPQFLGSTFSRITMMYGMVSGMVEMATVVSKLCAEIFNKLKQQKPTLSTLLRSRCGLSKEMADKVGGAISFKLNSKTDFEIEKFPPLSSFANDPQQHNQVKDQLTRLHQAQLSFKMEDSDVSQMQKYVVDRIAGHIIQIANSHLVSPVMSAGVGSLVAKISADLQDRFLVNQAQNTDEQNEVMDQVKALKTKAESELTEDEKKFLEVNDRKNTFAGQITANAKDYTIAWQKRQIVAKAMEKRAKEGQSSGSGGGPKGGGPQSKNAQDQVVDSILTGGPTDMAGMFVMAAENGVDIKIVDDPNYKPSQEDKDKGLKIVLFEKGKDGTTPGHFSIITDSGDRLDVSTDSTKMDCGYAVMAHLTGKSADQLRVELAGEILDNPVKFKEINSTSNWIRDRYPQEAARLLMVGGLQIMKDPFYGNSEADLRLEREHQGNAEDRLDDVDVLEVLLTDKTALDGPGEVYIYEKKMPDGTSLYKIGFSKSGDRRVDCETRILESERRNKEGYTFIHAIETPACKWTEKVVHQMAREGRQTPLTNPVTNQILDGGTEYFKGDCRQFVKYMEVATEEARIKFLQN